MPTAEHVRSLEECNFPWKNTHRPKGRLKEGEDWLPKFVVPTPVYNELKLMEMQEQIDTLIKRLDGFESSKSSLLYVPTAKEIDFYSGVTV